jgi:hypothetical protein
MNIKEFVHAWQHADKQLALEYFKSWFKFWHRWHLSRHKKAIIAQSRFGHFHFCKYYSLDGKKLLGFDFFVHLGASLDLYHTPALEKLGRVYTEEEAPELKIENAVPKPVCCRESYGYKRDCEHCDWEYYNNRTCPAKEGSP